MLAGCSKDEILNHYNNIVQSAGSIELTGKSSLQGEKEKGIDDYTGTYTADYANFSGTEYLFGGTSIKREAGKELSIDCTLEITEGTAKVFWISGSDEAVTLIEATGTYSDTINFPVNSFLKEIGTVRIFFNVLSVCSREIIYPAIRLIHIGKIMDILFLMVEIILALNVRISLETLN